MTVPKVPSVILRQRLLNGPRRSLLSQKQVLANREQLNEKLEWRCQKYDEKHWTILIANQGVGER